MTRRSRWVWIALTALVVVGLASTTAGAADKSKVDKATRQVDQGAKQIGQGKVGEGVKETAKGVGNTVVEGAKYTGETIKEFFRGK